MREFLVLLKNLWVFVTEMLWRGVPLRYWRQVWEEANDLHAAEVRRMVWELKKQGKVREDEEGRLWPVDDE